ncbi:MAG TPA: dual specificity protein phosphatase family protein [Blastocatellia bacterium]|nr:dual specificity protein phosphatase family protein [Blastocatellia bacterium]
MRVIRRLSPAASASAAVLIALVMLTAAQAAQSEKSPKVRVQNFGCVNEKLYRGAQPKAGDYRDLAAMGIKTIIDLQREGEADEQRMVEAAGMKFYRIPMSDKDSPSAEQSALFLSLVNNPENQPVFIHCKGGRHRTGAMTALYRMTHDEWTADRAYGEMKQYDFEHGMGHGALKSYVYYYYSRMDHKPVVVNADPNK